MTAGGALMPAARCLAGEATAQYPLLAPRIAPGDPLDRLVERLRPAAARSVDTLQVAAALETSGVTDHAARVRFGFADVFDLAEAVRLRVPPVAEPDPVPAPRPRSETWRDIGHGGMYLMAAAAFPPAVASLGWPAPIVAIMTTGAVGWVLSGVISWLAYRLIGEGQAGSADRLLRWGTMSAVPLGAATGGAVAAVAGFGPGVVLVTAAAMAYQLAVTVLVIHRLEAPLFAAMIPGVVTGVAYVVVGPALLPLAVAAALGSVTVVFGLAVWVTFGRAVTGSRLRATARRDWRRLLAVFAFTALSAAFFLYPQARHLTSRLDIAVAVLPLMAGMGVVEWRARRFPDDARALLVRVTHPRQFATRVWFVVLSGLVTCVAVVGVLAGVLLCGLAATGHYTEAAAAMAGAGTLLAGAYFLGFLLANLGRYGWLCVSLMLGLITYEVARFVLPGTLGDTRAFQIAAAELLLLYAVGLLGILGEARRHR